jgi:hypothetical protein
MPCKCVQECDEKGGVVGTKFGMGMEDALLANGCAPGDIPSTLSRDIHNGTVTNNVLSPSLSVG